jgi:glycosyltransferase involved in cell wall biosynthesis
MDEMGLSIIIPTYNEAGAIGSTLDSLKSTLSGMGVMHEIIVVDDGSDDGTSDIVARYPVRIVKHPVNSGYGRSILSGIEAATYRMIAITDADGTYPVAALPNLWAMHSKGFAMTVGARTGPHVSPSIAKGILRSLFRCLAEFTCGRRIPDINSGFRIFDKRPVLAWRESLSMGFSFTTTITLLFMLNHGFVGYMPIDYQKREGKSKIKMWRDTLRSLQIIVTTIAQYNPLKLFVLLLMMQSLGSLLLLLIVAGPGWLIAWQGVWIVTALGIVSLQLLKPRAALGVDTVD